MEADGWLTFQVPLAAQPGRRDRLDVDLHDVHGFRLGRTLELVGAPATGSVLRGRLACL
jgi:hypothetical protein